MFSSGAFGAVVINEIMADNASTAKDQDGEYEDWIELYNTGTSAVSLSGYHLSDDTATPAKWTFPDVTIAAGGYLIVWADNNTTQTGLHANFKLSASGETLILSSSDSTVIDQVTFGTQTTDISTARYPNGTGAFIQMKPTYAAANIVSDWVSGDLNGDMAVDITDAVLALQVVAGMTPSATVYPLGDINGDSKIGLAEALYALRKAAAVGEETQTGGGTIVLSSSSISTTGYGTTVSGSTATITMAGTYTISGTLTNGQIIVDTSDTDAVNLVLNGANITCSSSSPIYVFSGNDTVITLADNKTNTITDGSTYVYATTTDTEPDAAIFSKSDLTIEGNGTLTVVGKYKDGIASKDGLTINGGTIKVTAADDGIRGKDYVVITGGTITVNASGDGLKSTNDEDTAKGYVSISGGVLNITSGADAIQAQTDVNITGGQFTLTSGGGSSYTVSGDATAKGIKATSAITIDSGTFTVNSADDTIHSNGSVLINGGTYALTSGDDGIHADATLTINGGTINISKCYEGIESAVITINDGTIHITASDDGVNGAGGVDGSGTGTGDGFTQPSSGSYHLYINGGYLAVTAAGDGIDVNGSIDMTGGTVIVHGPTASDNGALDYDGTFKITGGFLVAAGSSGMLQTASSTSTQNSVMLRFSVTKSANTIYRLQDSSGTGILTFAPSKSYQAVVFSSPQLTMGSTYTVYIGGSSTGTATDGLYTDGTYTAGTNYGSFTVSKVVSSYSSSY